MRGPCARTAAGCALLAHQRLHPHSAYRVPEQHARGMAQAARVAAPGGGPVVAAAGAAVGAPMFRWPCLHEHGAGAALPTGGKECAALLWPLGACPQCAGGGAAGSTAT